MPAPAIKYFDQWREEARRLLAAGVEPDRAAWQDGWQRQTQLALVTDGNPPATPQPEPGGRPAAAFRVPSSFLKLARSVACHRDARRWDLLYRLLWRLTHGEPQLLEVVTDDDVYRARAWAKQVRRDAHKMKAFVRFRRCDRDGAPWYIAWHRPDHRVVRAVAPFFADRFSSMKWSILTPEESVSWDLQQLVFGPGLPRDAAPHADELERMWLTYYGATFNPARVKLAAMRAEMPVRHWPTLPETQVIDWLLDEAPQRVAEMVACGGVSSGTAAAFLPAERDLPSLRSAARSCRACPLHANATQTVFGEGPPEAQLVLVGEQPGDEEDRSGRPFVGPAGRLLDEILRAAEIRRDEIYVTNAVKHFKYVRRGKRRLHCKPNRTEVVACQAWLESELTTIRPRVLVCLGATAATSLISPALRISDQRGKVIPTRFSPQTIATYHPSAILWARDEAAASAKRDDLISDLQLAKSLLAAIC